MQSSRRRERHRDALVECPCSQRASPKGGSWFTWLTTSNGVEVGGGSPSRATVTVHGAWQVGRGHLTGGAWGHRLRGFTEGVLELSVDEFVLRERTPAVPALKHGRFAVPIDLALALGADVPPRFVGIGLLGVCGPNARHRAASHGSGLRFRIGSRGLRARAQVLGQEPYPLATKRAFFRHARYHPLGRFSIQSDR